MRSFGFTRKKFTALSDQGRHRHLTAWLTTVFQALRTGRVSPEQWDEFVREYAKILDWGDLDLPGDFPRGTACPNAWQRSPMPSIFTGRQPAWWSGIRTWPEP